MRSIHTGHRKRAREEFLARGLSGLADHRVLELLLFYAIPQRNVNPLAHRLIDRFGSLSGVFHAPYEQLMQVKGVGENTAALIRLVPAVAGRYLEQVSGPGEQLTEDWQFQELLLPVFFGAHREMAYLVCMDGKNKLLACRPLAEGVTGAVEINTRKVVETALGCNAVKVVLAHNHTSGVAMFSSADVAATRELLLILQSVGIELIDHMVFAEDEMVSMRASGLPLWTK